MKTLIHVETNEYNDVIGMTGFAWPEGRTWIMQWAPGVDVASDLGAAVSHLCQCCQEDALIGATRSFPPITVVWNGGYATAAPKIAAPEAEPCVVVESWRDRAPLL